MGTGAGRRDAHRADVRCAALPGAGLRSSSVSRLSDGIM